VESSAEGPASERPRTLFLGKRHLAFTVVAIAVLSMFYTSAPRERTVGFRLGTHHKSVTGIEIGYTSPGEPDEVRHVVRKFIANDAPSTFSDHARLANGTYIVEIGVASGEKRHTDQRRVTIHDDSHTIDVSDLVDP